MFLWNDRARYLAQQQAEIDAIPAPSGQPGPNCEPIRVKSWWSKREKNAVYRRTDNSKPRRKDHRRGLLHA